MPKREGLVRVGRPVIGQKLAGAGHAERVKPRHQPVTRLRGRDRGRAAAHIGLHPAGMIDPHRNAHARQIAGQIAPQIQRRSRTVKNTPVTLTAKLCAHISAG